MAGSMGDGHRKPLPVEFAEVDPTGRYGRYDDVLGKGSSKTVYRAFDEYEGMEVAWNQVKLQDFLQNPGGLERIYCEIHLLKTLRHKNIMKFYTSWIDVDRRNLNFITEMFTSGTLRQYRQKHAAVNMRAVKDWCRQILRGLVYLHSRDPPVIHRDLKCDNIFINGNQGEVKIGDFGLAAFLRNPRAVHCVGTPEFMAPEVYDEEYNELVDIYSFGMCVLEMVTLNYPYNECTHPVQIYKKVISGTKPEALYRLNDLEVRQFVEKCLATASQRLSARELLNDPFLQIDECDPVSREVTIREAGHLFRHTLLDTQFSIEPFLSGFSNTFACEMGNGRSQIDFEQQKVETYVSQGGDSFPDFDITVKGRTEHGSIYLSLRITDKEGRVRNIHFPFDIEMDTALIVATEMVAELDITDLDVTRIAEIIDSELSSLVPGWKPGPRIEDTQCHMSQDASENQTSNLPTVGFLQNYSPSSNHLQRHHYSHRECAAMTMSDHFEESNYDYGKIGQAPSSSSEGINLSLPSSTDTHSDEGGKEYHEPAKYVNSVYLRNSCVQPTARKYFSRLSCGSTSQESLEMLDLRYQPHLPNLSNHYEDVVRQESRWSKAKYKMEMQDSRKLQIEGSCKASNFIYELHDREQEREYKDVSSTKPPQTFTAKAPGSLHLGERKYAFHHPQICKTESARSAISPVGRNDTSNWFCHSNSDIQGSIHHKTKHDYSAETMFSVKDLYKGVLLLSCVPRTKALSGASIQ